MDIEINRSVRRSIKIQIRPDGRIIVDAPVFMLRSQIDRFLEEKKDWIDKHRPRVVVPQRAYHQGATFLYLGSLKTIDIGQYQSVHVDGDKLCIPVGMEFRIKTEVERWYRHQAKEIITERVKRNAEAMDMRYGSLSFTDTSSKWGSCTDDNRLQFCWRLVMAPIIVINYVVIHGLAHTKIKNHQEEFWRLVRTYNPSFKQQIKWLKLHGHTLVY